MASIAKRLAANVAGDFFVDESCIDCDTCRWMLPAVFDRANDQSRVHRQPSSEREKLVAAQALLACPTGSIGSLDKTAIAPARESFPLPISEDVFHCGYHAESSFGAASYFLRRPPERGGNVLVDCPRWNDGFVKKLESLGGVSILFLTHGDDLADQSRYAKHFGCRRVMHEADAPGEIETIFSGVEPFPIDKELLAIPVPGHTQGSACLLYREKFLFTGDHLAWSERRKHLYAFRDACWYDWNAQILSMKRLARHRFEWVLPGHGWRAHVPAGEMPSAMERCLAWMQSN